MGGAWRRYKNSNWGRAICCWYRWPSTLYKCLGWGAKSFTTSVESSVGKSMTPFPFVMLYFPKSHHVTNLSLLILKHLPKPMIVVGLIYWALVCARSCAKRLTHLPDWKICEIAESSAGCWRYPARTRTAPWHRVYRLPRGKAREVTHGELQLVDDWSEVDTKMWLQRQPSYSVCLHSEIAGLCVCRNMGTPWGQMAILANWWIHAQANVCLQRLVVAWKWQGAHV